MGIPKHVPATTLWLEAKSHRALSDSNYEGRKGSSAPPTSGDLYLMLIDGRDTMVGLVQQKGKQP